MKKYDLTIENELAAWLEETYGFATESITPAKRGFYGETWRLRTAEAEYFVKLDGWPQHKESYRRSLAAVEYMTGRGIDSVPRVIKTLEGCLYGYYGQAVVGVFEYVPGENREDYPIVQLFEHLARVYSLEPVGLALPREGFGTELLEILKAQCDDVTLTPALRSMLCEKEQTLRRYGERLGVFSGRCRAKASPLVLTHGDAGGNCILEGERFTIVDWDSVKLAPIERDAWFFMCDEDTMETIGRVLRQAGVNGLLDSDRLCYYCYFSFFYYLTEYLAAFLHLAGTPKGGEIEQGLLEYLADSWIYKHLAQADGYA